MDEQSEPNQTPHTTQPEQAKPEAETPAILPGQNEAFDQFVPAIPAPSAQSSGGPQQPVEPPATPNPTPHIATPSVGTLKEQEEKKPPADTAKAARAAIQSKKRDKLERILEEVTAKGSISNNEVEKLLGISDATASRYLVTLQKEGSLKRIGRTGKAVRYEPAKNGDLG